MTNPRPRGGATYDAFTPPPAARDPFMIAPFTCTMTPTKRAIRRAAYSDNLSLGLLSNTPDSDGEGGIELTSERYGRNAIRLVGKDIKMPAVADKVVFDLFALPAIKCLAIFNGADEIEAYGVPMSIRTGPKAAPLEFAPHAISVRMIAEKAR